MTVEELAEQESILIERVHAINADIHEKIAMLEASDIFDEYRKIHDQYVHMAVADENLEALKRAIFIQWFALAEPAWLSGIGDLEPSTVSIALSELRRRILNGELDDEFRWMLQCYFNVQDAFITTHKEFDQLAEYFQGRQWNQASIQKFSFDGRGQMGMYWSNRNDA